LWFTRVTGTVGACGAQNFPATPTLAWVPCRIVSRSSRRVSERSPSADHASYKIVQRWRTNWGCSLHKKKTPLGCYSQAFTAGTIPHHQSVTPRRISRLVIVRDRDCQDRSTCVRPYIKYLSCGAGTTFITSGAQAIISRIILRIFLARSHSG